MTTRTVSLDGVGPVDVTVDEHGEGQPFLLLHGGGGPDTTARFGELLATSQHLRVLSCSTRSTAGRDPQAWTGLLRARHSGP